MTAPNSWPRARRFLAHRVVDLGRERPFAHARHIGLGHADHGADARRPHAGAGDGATRRGGGRSDKRIGPVVDVQQRALRALEHHALAFADRLIQQRGRVGHIGSHLLRRGRVLVINLRRVERVGAEKRMGDRILLPAGVLDMRFQNFGVQQVHHAQTVAVHLVFVRRPDAAAGRADLCPSRRALARQLDHPVIGQDHLRAIGDEELPRVSTPSPSSFSTSFRNATGSRTTPFPMTARQSGRRRRRAQAAG